MNPELEPFHDASIQLLLACTQQDSVTALHILQELGKQCKQAQHSKSIKQDFQQLMTLCINISDPMGTRPVLACANYGMTEVLQQLLQLGAMTNVHLEPSLNTPLHLAASKGHIECVKALLGLNITPCFGNGIMQDAGACVKAVNAAGDTPLMFACGAGHIGITARLLKAGSVINVKNKSGFSPLGIAAAGGHALVVKALLKAASIHTAGCEAAGKQVMTERNEILQLVDNQGNTPLHFAASSGHTEVVKLLLEAGADPLVRNHAGRTAVGEAKHSKDQECIKLLTDSVKLSATDDATNGIAVDREMSAKTGHRALKHKKSKEGDVQSASTAPSVVSHCDKLPENTSGMSDATNASHFNSAIVEFVGQPFQLETLQPIEEVTRKDQPQPSVVLGESTTQTQLPHTNASHGDSLKVGDGTLRHNEIHNGSKHSKEELLEEDGAGEWIEAGMNRKHRKQPARVWHKPTTRSHSRGRHDTSDKHTEQSDSRGGHGIRDKLASNPWVQKAGQQQQQGGEADKPNSSEQASVKTSSTIPHSEEHPQTLPNNSSAVPSLHNHDRAVNDPQQTPQASASSRSVQQIDKPHETEQAATQRLAQANGNQKTDIHTRTQPEPKDVDVIQEPHAKRPSAGTTSSPAKLVSNQVGDIDTEHSWVQEAFSLLEDMCPEAVALDILPQHVLGLQLDSLSWSQLEALETVHRTALARLSEARMSLVREQERARLQEAERLRLEVTQLQAQLALQKIQQSGKHQPV